MMQQTEIFAGGVPLHDVGNKRQIRITPGVFSSALFGGDQSAPRQLLVMTRAVANKDVRVCIKRVSTTVLVSTHGTEVHLWKVLLVVMLRNHRSHEVSGEIDGGVSRSLRWFANYLHFNDLATYSCPARSLRWTVAVVACANYTVKVEVDSGENARGQKVTDPGNQAPSPDMCVARSQTGADKTHVQFSPFVLRHVQESGLASSEILHNKKNGEQVSLLPLLPGLSYSIDPIPVQVTLSVTEVLRPVRHVTGDITDDTTVFPKMGALLCAERCLMARETADDHVRRIINVCATARCRSTESAQIRWGLL